MPMTRSAQLLVHLLVLISDGSAIQLATKSRGEVDLLGKVSKANESVWISDSYSGPGIVTVPLVAVPPMTAAALVAESQSQSQAQAERDSPSHAGSGIVTVPLVAAPPMTAAALLAEDQAQAKSDSLAKFISTADYDASKSRRRRRRRRRSSRRGRGSSRRRRRRAKAVTPKTLAPKPKPQIKTLPPGPKPQIKTLPPKPKPQIKTLPPRPKPSGTPAKPFEGFRRRRSTKWPARDKTKCAQNTKQKAMYGHFTFSPSLASKPATDVSVSVVWEDLVTAPWRSGQGGVYAAWTFAIKNGPSGYMGAQIKPKGGQFLFSVWDSDRWIGRGHSKKPKASSGLVWALDTAYCRRNCQDCGLKDLRVWKAQGLTTGTQCRVPYEKMMTGGRFDIHMYRTKPTTLTTISTKDYGGMPKTHGKFGEVDRTVTGTEWVVTAKDVQTGKEIHVGKLLFEGSGTGLGRIATFDEMLGCNHCNDAYHRDTRYGPFLKDGNLERKPVAMTRSITKQSSCNQFRAVGSKADTSITFEGGPGAVANFPKGGKNKLW